MSRLFMSLLLLLSWFSLLAKDSPLSNNASLLLKLDDIIKNHQHYIDLKEESLQRLKDSLKKSKYEQERIGLLKMIRDTYLVYDADSALKYASCVEKILQDMDKTDDLEITNARIKQAYIYGIMGIYANAERIMSELDTNVMDVDTKIEYYITQEYVSAMKMVFYAETKDKSNEFNNMAVCYLDSINMLIKNNKSDHLWIPVATYAESWIDKTPPDKVDVQRLIDYMDKEPTPSRETAINSYWLSRYYKKQRDEDKMVRYLILSAINDAQIENREVAAIQELANYLFEHGELERAYNYFTYSTEIATLYQNRNRMISISNMFPSVRNAYMAEINKSKRNLYFTSIVLGIFTVMLIVGTIMLSNRIRRLKQTRKELHDSNESLNKTIAILEATNNDLEIANSVKRGMISLTFKLNSDYIVSFDDFRNKVLRRFTMKKYDEVKSLLMDPEILEDMYADFYKNFDQTVITIFPNFVEEFNSLVDDENKIPLETIEKTKTLTTRMRIYALKRLGIEKSGQIAKILNISIRTVYNNKL